MVYNAYIMSVFDYCCLVWANVSNSELHLSKVFRTFRKEQLSRLILKGQMVTPRLSGSVSCRFLQTAPKFEAVKILVLIS